MTISLRQFYCIIIAGEETHNNRDTLRNKPEIPKEFLAKKTREINSSLFGFADGMALTSYVPEQNKTVILLSTQILSTGTDVGEDKNKPHMILHYNDTKGAADTGNQMTREYSYVWST